MILRRVDGRANVSDVAAQTCKILSPNEALATSRVNSVRIVVDCRDADERGQAAADFVAEVAACLERVANPVGEEGRLVERDLVLAELVAGAETPIFRNREPHADRAAGTEC